MARIFSGIQPSGELHIGNYLGAVKNWVALQSTAESYFCIVDYHAIVVPYAPSQLRERREQFIFNGVFQMRWKSLLSDKVSEFARQPRMIEINIAEQIYARDEPRHAGGQHHHKHGRQI